MRAMALAELRSQVRETRAELAKEKAVAAGGTRPENPGKIRSLRRNIARLLTVMRQKQLAGEKEEKAGEEKKAEKKENKTVKKKAGKRKAVKAKAKKKAKRKAREKTKKARKKKKVKLRGKIKKKKNKKEVKKA